MNQVPLANEGGRMAEDGGILFGLDPCPDEIRVHGL